MDRKTVTVVCPIYNEEKFIEGFINSVMSQDYPSDMFDVMLVDGMSSDQTRTIIDRMSKRYTNLHIIDNPQHTVPYALNKAIKSSDSDVVIRMDAHCIYPANYISRLVDELYRLNADNVGGVWHTLPSGNTTTEMAIAIASSHPFGVGGSTHKIGTNSIKKVDTVPFGCYRREVFQQIGLFDEELTRNQDDEFNARLIQHGGSIYIIPDVVIQYTARDTMSKMRRMYYQYGLFKPLVNKKLGSPATIRQFIPALFVVGLILGLALSMVSLTITAIYATIITLYVVAGIIIGIKKGAEHNKPSLIAYMPYTFFNIHMSYGIGYIIGVGKILMNKSFNVNINR